MLEYLEFRITPEDKENILMVQQTRIKIFNNFSEKEFIRKTKYAICRIVLILKPRAAKY